MAAIVVMWTTTTLLALAFAAANGTNDGWVNSHRYSYKLFECNATFDEAESKCVAEGGHLASIHDKKENELIYKMAKTKTDPKTHNDFVWIGLRQVNWPKDKKWTWTDGTPVDFWNWAPSEPDNIERKEHCAQFYNLHKETVSNVPKCRCKKWNDYPCQSKMKFFICKRPDAEC
uniref:C-type lectin domain-containing protein n=1 Tax=Haemonchus contortus TaxID=6289 RepID=A0A7I4YIV2_HAECO